MAGLILVAGLVALVGGAEVLIRGASGIALRTGLPPVVVGLTVVAFGTSAPELAVGIGASRTGQPGLAVGNVVGSNIANILLVLGVSAAVGGGIAVAEKLVRVDAPLVAMASVVVLVMSLDNRIGRLEGSVLFLGIVGYIAWTLRSRAARSSGVEAEFEEALGKEAERPWYLDVVLLLSGIALLVVGAEWIVGSASDIARSLGVSDLVIGLSVVAIGTSAPELATCVVAAVRGERDLAVGNVVGSNLFNLLAVLGLTSLFAPRGLPVSDDALRLDMPIMVAVAIACLPVFLDGFVLTRREGVAFALYYLAYIAFLVLDATDSGLRDPFAIVMGVFVLPLTAFSLVVIAWRTLSRGRPSGS